MRKLLYIHNQSFSLKGTGGLNTTLLQVFSMCNAFHKQGLEVILYMEDTGKFKEYLNDFMQNGFSEKLLFKVKSWNRKSENRLLNRISLTGEVKKIIFLENPDLIFTREAAFLNSIMKSGKKVVYESHNALMHNRFEIIHKYLQRMITLASRKDNFLCLFSISQSLMYYWKSLAVPEYKLFAWHDGFDEGLFRDSISKKKARLQLGLPIQKQIITYTGGLYPDREIENIIRLAEYFNEQLFIVIGGPENNRKVYEQISKERQVDNILFMGFRDHVQIPNYLYASDVLLALWSSKVPTINYCSPLKLFEYMASGRVILAHSFPTIKEVLSDGIDATFCEPGNFDSMKKGLAKAIKESAGNQLGINARQKAFREYSWDIRVVKLLEFINLN